MHTHTHKLAHSRRNTTVKLASAREKKPSMNNKISHQLVCTLMPLNNFGGWLIRESFDKVCNWCNCTIPHTIRRSAELSNNQWPIGRTKWDEMWWLPAERWTEWRPQLWSFVDCSISLGQRTATTTGECLKRKVQHSGHCKLLVSEPEANDQNQIEHITIIAASHIISYGWRRNATYYRHNGGTQAKNTKIERKSYCLATIVRFYCLCGCVFFFYVVWVVCVWQKLSKTFIVKHFLSLARSHRSEFTLGALAIECGLLCFIR